MDFYNQSLCYAENGSKNVALAYAHRSACFFHMEKYEEALIDIQLAKNANVSEDQLTEMDQRKSECEKLIVKKPLENLPKLSYEADTNFPSIANVLELKNSPEFGRYFVAKCDIPCGKIVLAEESFIGVRKDNPWMYCSECLQMNTNLIPCQSCATTVFCSNKCMAKNTAHKWECGTNFNLFDCEIKFQGQAIFLAIDTFGSIDQLMEFIESILCDVEKQPMSLLDSKSKYHFFFNLSKSLLHADDILLVYKIYIDLMKIPKIAALFDSKEKQRFLAHLVAHHFLVILNNAHGNNSYQSVGAIFSMFNHSCTPNVMQFFDGKQHLVTIRPVKKGDQLFISYLGKQKHSLEQRQEICKSKWNFICNCERCNSVGEIVDHNTITSDVHYIFVLENGYTEDQSSEVLDHCEKFLNNYAHLPWSDEIQFVIDIYCAHLSRNNLNQLL
ncbi:SET and MYND domain-containing protein DDB_G0273589-like isoform X2 [Sitodiplosis mosellana]|nr:SET and MYND domain-containing protein DDB_G0273589-like isoform X2 [Sitodiplosis mosellana]